MNSVRLRHQPLRVFVVAAAAFSVLAGCGRGEAVVMSSPTPEPLARPAASESAVDFRDVAAPPAQMVKLENGRNRTGWKVVDGVLTHGAPTAPDAASYLTRKTPQKVREIGAIADLDATGLGSTGHGSIALVISQGPIPRTPDAPAPGAATHFVADAQGWAYGIWEPGAQEQTVLRTGVFGADFDRRHAHFSVTLTGDKAQIRLPDATAVDITDKRITSYGGDYATWELFEAQPELIPAGFHEIWAD